MSEKPTYEELEQRVRELEEAKSERKLAEKALRESEENFRRLFEQSIDAVIIHKKGKIMDANDSTCKMLGYSKNQLRAMTIMDLHDDSDREEIKQKIYRDKRLLQFETRWIKADGTSIDVEISSNIIDLQERLTQAVIRDIAERKRADAAIRESERRFRLLVENTTDTLFLHDFDGKIIDVNEHACKNLGYTREELLSLSIQDIDQDVVSGGHFEQWEQMVPGMPITLEGVHRRKDGTTFPVEIRLVVFESGEERLMLGVVRDITERKRAEDALREAYNIINRSPAVVFLWKNAEGWPVEFVSENVKGLFGYTAEEFTSGKISYAVTVHPDDLERVARELTAYSKEEGRKDFIHEPYRIVTKDRETKWLNDMTFIRRNEKGDITHYQGIVLDISERVNTEDEKARLQAQLQRALKMEAIGTLAGGVAHDLNNILSGLVSYPDLLLVQLPQDSPLRGPIVTMQDSGQKAADIVQDLLTLARRGVATMEVVNLNERITEYLRSPECEKLKSFHPEVKIQPDLNEEILNISGSKVHLTKTIMNLVSNAAEAMTGGGTITISTENRYIDRLIRGYDRVEEGDYVILSVSDTGVGIPAEDLERIFEPFYTKKVMGRSGTGLGMAVVWGTVKDHRGYIDVQSTEGKGTTFSLYFPATRQRLAHAESPLPMEAYRGKGELLLVVDDVKEQRDIASGLLSRLGYAVSSVASGEEAVEYLKTHTADLLILDMIMEPGMDGLDTYREILALHPHQKAIITSGFSETERVKEAINLGAGQYIRKPYTMEKIGRAVREELEK
jgi:two-component system cell cycle sensor histidine kinase/response regulator CckA